MDYSNPNLWLVNSNLFMEPIFRPRQSLLVEEDQQEGLHDGHGKAVPWNAIASGVERDG